MTTGERIRLLRERRGMSGVQFAARTGLDQSYLSKVELNKAGWSMDGLEAMAHALGVTPATLLDGTLDADDSPRSKPGMIPIYDFIQAGSPKEVSGSFRDQDIERYIHCDLPNPRELFGLTVRGRSMEPEFLEGDTVIFRRGLEPHPGDLVAANETLKGGTFKRYRDLGFNKDGRHVFALMPLNENYPGFRSDEGEWTIEGTLVRHVRDYRK